IREWQRRATTWCLRLGSPLSETEFHRQAAHTGVSLGRQHSPCGARGGPLSCEGDRPVLVTQCALAQVGMSTEHSEVTRLLKCWTAGDLQAREQLIPLVYDRLRELAHWRLRSAPGEC